MNKIENYNLPDFESFKDYLDQRPEDSWLQIRELGKGKKHLFIPLFIIEATADICFREWYVVDESFLNIQNGVACTVKINALPDYPGSDWITFTGTAAVIFKENAKNHIEFDIPNSRERAIGKAFATLGNVFGRSLNRSYKDENGQQRKIKRGFTFRVKKDDKTAE